MNGRQLRLLSIALALVASFGTACEDVETAGPTGPKGDTGPQGEPGSSCSVEDKGDGTAIVSCTDGTSAVVGSPAAGGGGGESGSNSVISVAESETCPSGGKAISVGVDVDNSGDLSSSEISSTFDICNGSMGAIGPDGASGENCWQAPGISGDSAEDCISVISEGVEDALEGTYVLRSGDDMTGSLTAPKIFVGSDLQIGSNELAMASMTDALGINASLLQRQNEASKLTRIGRSILTSEESTLTWTLTPAPTPPSNTGAMVRVRGYMIDTVSPSIVEPFDDAFVFANLSATSGVFATLASVVTDVSAKASYNFPTIALSVTKPSTFVGTTFVAWEFEVLKPGEQGEWEFTFYP